MKQNKIFSSLLMAMMAISTVTLTSCDNDDDEPVNALKFGSKAVEVNVGESVSTTISGGTTPYTAVSSNKNIAEGTINQSSIVISGKQKGQAILTVTDKNNLQGRITVTVKEASAKALSFDQSSLSLAVGKDATVQIKNGTAPYTATSKDTGIATVSVKDNKITVKAVKAGQTTVSVVDKNKLAGTISVTVK